MKRCYLVGAGSLYDGDLPFTPEVEDLVIAADGGFEALQSAGMQPDLLVGDFDSMANPRSSCETLVLPVEKDDTDIAYGIKEGFARGYRVFTIYGGLGGNRISHTLANIQLLGYIQQQGGEGVLIAGKTKIFLLSTGQTYHFPPDQQGIVSVFSYHTIATVSLRGLQYPLNHFRLSNQFPLGVSNHLTGTSATIEVHEGIVLVVLEEAEE